MERVGDSSADFEPEMTAEIAKEIETEKLTDFSPENHDFGEHSLVHIENSTGEFIFKSKNS